MVSHKKTVPLQLSQEAKLIEQRNFSQTWLWDVMMYKLWTLVCCRCFKEQLISFYPMWTLIWVFKMLEVVKDLLQWGQLKGLSPVWTLECCLRAEMVREFYLRMLKTNFMLLQMSLIMRQNCILSTSSRLKD